MLTEQDFEELQHNIRINQSIKKHFGDVYESISDMEDILNKLSAIIKFGASVISQNKPA